MEMKHENSGQCIKCGLIFNKYPGFHVGLKSWFMSVQKKMPIFHVCDAGRGKIDQEIYFARGATKAHFGESAHNFNCAIDSFFLIDGKYSLDKKLYDEVSKSLTSGIEWYGAAGSAFFELPHFQIANFKEAKESGLLKPVEPLDAASK